MATAKPIILVTGVGGQVGNALLETLAPLGSLVPVDVAAPAPTPPGFRAVDFRDLDALRQLVREVRPSVIVNPAAHTAVDKAESEESLAFAINAEAPGVLAAEAKRLGAAFIHYSTDYVFAGDGTRPWVETDPTGPLGAYGRTKLAGEDAVRQANDAHVILRTSWVVSAHGANFVKTMLRLGAEREELKVVADQIGAPTSAALLAQVTARILERGLARGFADIAGTYHLCGQGETSWHGLAEEVFRQARALGASLKVARVVPIPTEAYPTPAPRPKNSRMDCRKVMRTFDVALPDWRRDIEPVVTQLITKG